MSFPGLGTGSGRYSAFTPVHSEPDQRGGGRFAINPRLSHEVLLSRAVRNSLWKGGSGQVRPRTMDTRGRPSDNACTPHQRLRLE